MRRHRVISVSGRVQGVFFRARTKEMADELGISGTVQNQPDGTVRIEAEGEDDALRHFEAWCKTGPPLAKVERTVVTSGALKHFSKFVIVR